MEKLDFIEAELNTLEESGLSVRVRTVEGPQGAWIIVEGRKVLNLCSNNYLGLANSSQLKRASCKAIEAFGVGPGAVRTIAGTTSLHKELEQKLALFKEVESALSFQSGFCANLAVIPAIVGKEDVVFSDALNHASIIDGCRLSGARVVRYKHGNIKDLREKVVSEEKARRKMIITDGVFSMVGDIAPLPEIVEIAEIHNVITMVDDAHGEGVLGRGGRGIVNHFKLQGKVDIEVGTMSKAFGVVGGYIAGSKRLCDYLVQKGRPFLFSSALTAADVAACIAAVNTLSTSERLVNLLWSNAGFFQEGMRQMGFDLGNTETPITPVMIGDAGLAKEFSQKLFQVGVFAQAIAYPTVPKERARIRVMLSATHSREDLSWAMGQFEEIGKGLGVL
ncbi:MAG: glycine C-acetyltransferase [Candidatus Scalindua sp. AMX11]|nr:MAG: glycine C-acetyltransferase [Candidatus Scalindua sp.]NOG85102.1 glycine C-acetyltransferase [Planctomycetota bacterium]RZV69315.1 MAG: glycine C-acetyltransferase [Candidatus Scalindua sp. SCAELEC01]TDE66809.1 MAG: glycine C-acetyltransferase [Candidatus Scalindua sp. AMX11]